ncbi:3554_t:CDS:2 [Diversispora eburnea]|uniref:3554_t:CDS:1 n=1 Tax=Diversispora eburnea TaxID=1213867 RepID=A0A9N8YZU4_9GLOM|nr:3554_t:CDS:2 [Diversispora eburnea]
MYTKEHFIKNFGTWTSGNANIDKVIQEFQINNPEFNLQWIAYDNFHDIKYIGNSEHYTLHSATLRNYMDWEYCIVTLKELKDYNILEFLNSIKKVGVDVFNSYCFTRCFGISKNPSTNSYNIVMESRDDTIHNLSDFFLKLGWDQKIFLLRKIIRGLNILHENDFIHCDLHSKNILMTYCDLDDLDSSYVLIDPEFLDADDNREIMNKSREQKLLRSLHIFHPQSCYIGRRIYTFYELRDSLEDIKSGKCADPNLYTYNMDSEESSMCIDLET